MRPYIDRFAPDNWEIDEGVVNLYKNVLMSSTPLQKFESDRKIFACTVRRAGYLIYLMEHEKEEMGKLLYDAYARLDELEPPPAGMLSHLCQICRLQKNQMCEETKAGKICNPFKFCSQAEWEWLNTEEAKNLKIPRVRQLPAQCDPRFLMVQDVIAAMVHREVYGEEIKL